MQKANRSILLALIEDITEEKKFCRKISRARKPNTGNARKAHCRTHRGVEHCQRALREKAAQDAVTAERTRLARDLHDAVTQTLFSTTLIADVLPEIWEMNQTRQTPPGGIRLLTRGALAEMRTLLVELRPNALVEVPLPPFCAS